MPAQQCPGRDDQVQLAGQEPGQCDQDRPVGPGQLWSLHLALEDGDLMAQGQDLGVLGAPGSDERGKPAK
jgi:hypothetical protein